ncbi:hypothetical protein D3C72_2136790 [compost metagenome]
MILPAVTPPVLSMAILPAPVVSVPRVKVPGAELLFSAMPPPALLLAVKLLSWLPALPSTMPLRACAVRLPASSAPSWAMAPFKALSCTVFAARLAKRKSPAACVMANWPASRMAPAV